MLLVLDEVSFVGRALFGKMEVRGRQGRKDWLDEVDLQSDDEASTFGNVGLLLSGDPSQLPPIHDKELISQEKSDGKLDRRGKEVWEKVPHVIQLWRCHRQQGDADYAHQCLRLRDGTFSRKDWEDWLRYDLARGRMTEEQRLSFEKGKSIELVGTNAQCGRINGRRAVQRMTIEWGADEPRDARGIFRFAAEQPSQCQKMSASKFSGLRSTTHVVVGAEQMLMLNINPAIGLANGTTGTTVAVVPGDTAGSLPKCVILDVPTYTGPPLFEQKNDDEGNARRRHWVPIMPQSRSHDDKPWLSRRQVPLRLAYAITFNKSQGMSLARPTILDLSAPTSTSKYKPIRIRGMAFTGATRVSEKKYLAFRNLPNFEEFQQLMSSSSFQERVKHDKAMRLAHVRTLRELFNMSPEEEEEMHRKWDLDRGVPSTWTAPSELDKKLHQGSTSSTERSAFSVGDAVWCTGHPAVVCAKHETGNKHVYDVAYGLSGGKVRLLRNQSVLRPRFRTDSNEEVKWLESAKALLESSSTGPTPDLVGDAHRVAEGKDTSLDSAAKPAGINELSRASKRLRIAPVDIPSDVHAWSEVQESGKGGHSHRNDTQSTASPSSEQGQAAKKISSSSDELTQSLFHPMPNIGNTCYLNAAIQVLQAMLPCKKLLDEHANVHGGEDCVACALQQVMNMRDEEAVCKKKSCRSFSTPCAFSLTWRAASLDRNGMLVRPCFACSEKCNGRSHQHSITLRGFAVLRWFGSVGV